MGKLKRILGGMLAGGAGVATLAAMNALIARNASEPEECPLNGDVGILEWKYGQVVYRVAGPETAQPLVFIHRIGPGESSFTWRRNFNALAGSFRVYALDLLGFGFSDKPAHAPYSADLYVELIADFLREVVSGRSAYLVANSLSAAYAVRVADEQPELIDKLVLISPVISDSAHARPGMSGAAFYGLLHSPVLGTSFYNAMTSERSIRDYARNQLYYDRRFITKRVLAQLYAASHQQGAQHAVAAHISGYLNTDAREAFARIEQNITLLWGKQDQTNSIDQAAMLLRLNPRVRLEIFDHCRMLPHEEHSEKFNALLSGILAACAVAA